MAVIRVEKSSNYTVMSNLPIRDEKLSLKSLGLLCKMLSLPKGWEFSIRGLTLLCKEGKDTVQTCMSELEKYGYVSSVVVRNSKGQFSKVEYTIYETPHGRENVEEAPKSINPKPENPDWEKPNSENPNTENPAQLNKDISSKDKLNTDSLSIDPILSCESCLCPKPQSAYEQFERVSRKKVSEEEYVQNRELVKENIDYDALCYDHPERIDRIDELVELMTETICSGKKYIKIAGTELSTSIVRSRFKDIRAEHIMFVIDSMDKTTSDIRCMKSYLLTSLYNSYSIINHYFTSWVNHDEAQYYNDGGGDAGYRKKSSTEP